MRSEREFMVKSNQGRALWPYLVVLTILFVLSLAAPRSWDRIKPTTQPLPQQQAATPSPTVLQPQQGHHSDKSHANNQFGPLNPPVVEKVTQQYQEPAPAAPPLVPADVTLSAPITTGPSPELAERVAQVEHQWLAARERLRLNWEAARVELNNVTVPISRVLRPDVLARFIATRARMQRAQAAAQADQPPQPNSNNQAGNIGVNSPTPAPAAPTPVELSEHWPLASALIAQCGILRQNAETQLWANQTIALLESLATKPLHDPASRELLLGLRQLANHSGAMLARLGNVTDEALPLRRVQYDLVRRLELWETTAARAAEVGPWASCIVPSAERDTRVLQPTQKLLDFLATNPAGENWKTYLQVDQIHDLSRLTERPATTKRVSHGFPHGDVTQPVAKLINDRRQFAERVRSRAARPDLSAEQQAFLHRPELQGYLNGLRHWAVQPRLLADLLQTIENYEETRLPSDAADFGQAIADLQRSLDPRDQTVGKLLDQHYRNANARVTLTRTLLNRMLPKQEPTTERVNEVIAGTAARGQSTTTSEVAVRLVPHNDGWKFLYDIKGHVDSNTQSQSGPVTFVNRGASQYTAEKNVLISSAGIHSSPAKVFSNNRTQLACLQTEYDNVPLLGNLVRNVAEKKHAEARPAAENEVSCRVANKAAAKIDREVDERFSLMESKLRQNLIARLNKWGLDPAIVSMQTTEERATARFRFAGSQQLASHTARPLALSDSLSSMQLHESAMNNFLAGFEVSGRTWTLPELISHLQHKFGSEKAPQIDDLPENVVIRFADDDPVFVQCADDQLRVVVSIAELQQADRSWENVEFHVNYRLVAEGFQLKLVRDGAVSLRGDHTGRVDVVLRTIGSKLFPRDQAIALIPEKTLNDERFRGLAWSQVQIENGWVGLSLADETIVMARQKIETTTR